ncbi:MAG: glycosyltransferase family 2 protein [Candidatus Micrarchaeota archaeon]|nr:glycosyltransferase family 2 protein [Candidatus Micrarchaeota archaeon]
MTMDSSICTERDDMFTVIVPVYNEEENIEKFLKELTAEAKDIIVVDDGSTDKTYSIAKKFKVKVVRHKNNMGKSQAVITGLKVARSEAVVLIDGDNQLSPKYIPSFVKELERCDLVIGNRFLAGAKIPLHRKLANLLIAKLVSSKIPEVGDPLNGLRALRKSKFKDLEGDGFRMDLDMLFKAKKNNLRIHELPVSADYSIQKEISLSDYIKKTLRYGQLLLQAVEFLLISC